MAEGGREKDENPYSFKKFIKSKNNCRMSSDSDTEHSDEEGAVDLLENSCPLTRDDGLRSGRRTDDNPFSFKRFLQPAGSHIGSAGGASIATLDLANDLPDFVQDHYHSDREHVRPPRGRSQATTDAPLPDFALDTGSRFHTGDLHSFDASAAGGWTPGDADSVPSNDITSHHNESLDSRLHGPSATNSSLRNSRLSDFIDSDTESSEQFDAFALLDGSGHNNSTNGPLMVTANSSGGLPDFLSDSALGAVDVCARNAAAASNTEHSTRPLTNGFASPDSEPESVLSRLREENDQLRRQLKEAQELAWRQSDRASEAVKQMELSQQHEAEETAALEKMMQKVEANLETTTQRAVQSENLIVKLKQEVKTLQSRVEELESENSLLRGNPDVDVTVLLRDRMQFASQQLDSSANDAEQLLKQLLGGIDKLRMVSSVLASTDKVVDLPADGAAASEPNKQ